MRRALALSTVLFAAAPVAEARDPILNPPIACDLTSECFIPRYVDVDPSRGVADYRCGALAGDGHKGTDFALPSRAAMEAGVAVTPAAPGTVRRIRDGVPDTGPGASSDGQECGNGLVIGHGNGWETQYCHLKQGSIQVVPGQRVGKSTVLGEVGLSGQTTFPHVHLSLRKDGRVVDPFAPKAEAQCDVDAQGSGLWQDPPPYRNGGLIALGFWDAVPEYDNVRAGTATATTLPIDAPALVIWSYAFGGQTGDIVDLAIDGPSGPIVAKAVTLDKGQPLFFRAIGRRLPDGGWPPGRYEGRVTLARGGTDLETLTTTIDIGG